MPKGVSPDEGKPLFMIFPPTAAQLPLLKRTAEYRTFVRSRLSGTRIWFAAGRKFRKPNGEWVAQRRLMMLDPMSPTPVELGIHQTGSGGEITFNRLAAFEGNHADWLIWSHHQDRVLLRTMDDMVPDWEIAGYLEK